MKKGFIESREIIFENIQYESHAAIAKAFGINYRKFLGRLRLEWTLEEALKGRYRYIYNNKGYRTLDALCKAYNRHTKTVRHRLNDLGWSLERAIQTETKKKYN